MGRTRQYAGRVNVIKRIKIGKRWPFAAVVERNGKMVRDHVWVSGRDEHHPEGHYHIEWYQGGKRRRQSVGDFAEVVEAARRKSIEVNAQKAGIIEASQAPEHLRHGVDIRTLQSWMGHRDIKSTMVYLKGVQDGVPLLVGS